MVKKSFFKFIVSEILGVLAICSVLLPWVSYGIGSKTGLDVGHISIKAIAIVGFLVLLFPYFYYQFRRAGKVILYFILIFSSGLFLTFLYELVRVVYQITMIKNLPVEMAGVASLSAAKIHIGYGLYLGVVCSFILFLLNLVSLVRSK